MADRADLVVPTLAQIQASFAGGELSPYLYGRVELAKFHVGCRSLLNFLVHSQGGASNRPGTLFVGEVDDSSVRHRLIPFQFRTLPAGQTYVLVFGDGTMQVAMNNAVGGIGFVQCPTAAIAGITNANPGVVNAPAHGFTTGSLIPIVDAGGMTQLNGRTFQIAVVDADHFSIGVDTTGYGAYTSGGAAGGGNYTLVSPYAAADLPLLKYVQSADRMTLTHPAYPPQLLSRTGHAAWTFSTMLFVPQTAAPTGLAANSPGSAVFVVVTAINDATGEESLPSTQAGSNGSSDAWNWIAVPGCSNYNVYKQKGSVFGFVAQVQVNQWTDSNLDPDIGQTPPGARDPFSPGQITAVTGGGGSSYSASDTVSIATGTGSGASIKINVNGSGKIVSFSVLDAGTNYRSTDTATIHTSTGSGATVALAVGPLTGTSPGCSAFYLQRQAFGMTDNMPETLWFSSAGTTSNMNVSTPTQDSDAITRTMTSEQVNEIRHLVPVGTSMLALTSGAEFRVWPGPNAAALTPATCSTLPQTSLGSSHVKPVYTENTLLMVQEKGSVVQGLKYDVLQDLYTPEDFSVLAQHLLSDTGGNYQIQEWAFAQTPFRVVWAVRSDGLLLGFTFMKEQEVYAWHRHATDGLFESVCSVTEADGFGGYFDAVWLIANRTVNGVTRRYLERMAPRIFPTVADIWFVDCGLRYDGRNTDAAATLTLIGTNWIPGATVTVAASGLPPTDGQYYGLTGADGQTAAIRMIDGATATVLNAAVPVSLQGVATTNWSLMVTSVSGLDHLEGKTIAIVGDGSLVPAQAVSGGSVPLDGPYGVVTAGLAYTAELETLDLEVPAGGGTVQGQMKKIAEITVRVKDTRGARIGIAENDPNGNDTQSLVEAKQPFGNRVLGSALEPFNGDLQVTVPSDWNRDGRMFVQQTYPLPVTVLGLIPEINIGD